MLVFESSEQKVCYWADKYDGVYVVTGGVLNPSLTTIGTERVAVPEQFYKKIIFVNLMGV
jgi:endonuclease G